MIKLILKRLAILSAGLLVTAGSLLFASHASAKGTSNAADCPDTILAGIQRGVDVIVGGEEGCTPQTVSSGSNSQTNGTSPSSPSSDFESTGTVSSSAVTNDADTELAQDSLYVALGDSVAAGAGLPPNGVGDPACGISSEAYPTLVSGELRTAYYNHACSGATVGDLFSEQHLSNTSRDIEPQLDTAFSHGVPTLITITAGANDTYWQHFIRKCAATECGTDLDNSAASTLASALKLKLSFALNEIRYRSNGQTPTVVLTGYYKPFSESCAAQQVQVDAKEIAWLSSQTDALNSVIEDAAEEYSSFAHFAPLDFSGHELCSSDPWVQGLQDPAPFHPTARGQQEIAEAVLGKIR